MSTDDPRLVAGGADDCSRRSSTTSPGMTVGHAVLSNTLRAPVARRESRDGPRPRDRRDIRAGPRRGLVRGRARAIRDRPAADRAPESTASSQPSGRSRPCSPPEAAGPPGVTRDDPFYPLERRDRRPTAADRRRPADLSRRSEASRDARSPPEPPAAGSCPARTRATSRTSRKSVTRSSRRSSRAGRDPAAFEHRRPGDDRSRCRDPARGADRRPRPGRRRGRRTW